MCLYSKLILNPKYKMNKKNGGVIPHLKDERCKYVPIGCGNCIECCKQKAREWQIRLLEDIKTNTNGKFITLTFSDQSIKELTEDVNNYEIVNGKRIRTNRKLTGYTLDNAIAKRAMRLFLERWRKTNKTSLRHWMVTELGHNGTENIHLHGIIWTNNNLNIVEQHWKYGFVWKGKQTGSGKIINYVNEKTIGYICKYVHKRDEKHKHYKSKILTSPGIGSNYINTPDRKTNRYKATETKEYYRTRTGHKISMPIYWRNKIYSDDEREKLWLQKLDKEERWICGEKVSIKNGQEEYEKLTKWYREKNKQLGYGSDERNMDEVLYEEQRRRIAQETRIKKAEIKMRQAA